MRKGGFCIHGSIRGNSGSGDGGSLEYIFKLFLCGLFFGSHVSSIVTLIPYPLTSPPSLFLFIFHLSKIILRLDYLLDLLYVSSLHA